MIKAFMLDMRIVDTWSSSITVFSAKFRGLEAKRRLNLLQSRSDFTNQWAGAYYGGHFYDGYTYAFPAPHNPNMYAPAAYGAYPMYGTHQQQISLLFLRI
nr:polyadenylate-binding protein RBP47-like [Ipomoea batatas]